MNRKNSCWLSYNRSFFVGLCCTGQMILLTAIIYKKCLPRFWIIATEGVVLMKPLISVIIPTYRRTQSLRIALQSLCQQDYSPLEIILIDDNADPKWNKKVAEIAAELSTLLPPEYSFRRIVNAQNTGAAKSRNIGIHACKGAYVTFLDDDDIYLFNKISSQFAVMEAGTADFSLMDLELFHPDGQLVERKTHPYLNNFPDQKELIRLHLMYHLTGTDTMMFRRDYLLKTGGFGSVDIGDEFYLMMKAIEKGGRFVYLPQSLVHACVHYDGSGLSGGPLKRQGEEMLFQFKRTYFPNLSPSDIRFIRMRHHAVLAFAYLKQGDLLHFLCEAMQSFFLSPVGCIRMLSQRKNQK